MTHRILIVELEAKLFAAASLKEKRAVRQRLTDRLKAAYNVSVAETSLHDKWQRLGLTFAYVAVSASTAADMAATLRDACDRFLAADGEVTRFESEIL